MELISKISGGYKLVTEDHGWVQLREDPKVLRGIPHSHTSQAGARADYPHFPPFLYRPLCRTYLLPPVAIGCGLMQGCRAQT